jgi:hypothetical protein
MDPEDIWQRFLTALDSVGALEAKNDELLARVEALAQALASALARAENGRPHDG